MWKYLAWTPANWILRQASRGMRECLVTLARTLAKGLLLMLVTTTWLVLVLLMGDAPTTR